MKYIIKFQKLPREISGAKIISRFVDGQGFRYKWATEGLSENELHFKPSEKSMDMLALIKHIHFLAYAANTTFRGSHIYDKSLVGFSDMRNETLG